MSTIGTATDAMTEAILAKKEARKDQRAVVDMIVNDYRLLIVFGAIFHQQISGLGSPKGEIAAEERFVQGLWDMAGQMHNTVRLAVELYTSWLIDQLLKQDDITAPIAMTYPSAEFMEAYAEEPFNLPPRLFVAVIVLLKERSKRYASLPLIGQVRDGMIRPSPEMMAHHKYLADHAHEAVR